MLKRNGQNKQILDVFWKNLFENSFKHQIGTLSLHKILIKYQYMYLSSSCSCFCRRYDHCTELLNVSHVILPSFTELSRITVSAAEWH